MNVIKNNKTLEYTLTRKKVKNINLRIKSDCSVHISANSTVKISVIEDFILENFEKIQDIQSRFKCNQLAKISFNNGDIITLLGVAYTVEIRKNNLNSICIDNNLLVFNISNDIYEQKQLLFEQFTKDFAQNSLTELCHNAYELFKHDLPDFPILKFRKMKSRWGSCIPSKNQINLNTNLIFQPYNSAYYVVLHEFAHFYHQNHSKDFYNFVKVYMPDYLQHKNALRNI